jgi:4-aminobutyrate aminotransferase-like enzyme
LSVLRYLRQHELVDRARSEGEWFLRQLTRLTKHPSVGDVRGKGLFAGIEFVADRKTKEPFPPETGFAKRVVDGAWEMGVILRSETGTSDGVNGEHILLSPPLTIGRDELTLICQVLDSAISDAERQVGLAPTDAPVHARSSAN